MSEDHVITITTDEVGPEPGKPKSRRKPAADWKKTTRMKAVKQKEPDFIGKFELAKHLCCHIGTLNDWIADGTVPPPHSRPGERHPVWLRAHYEAYKATRKWPEEAYWNRRQQGA